MLSKQQVRAFLPFMVFLIIVIFLIRGLRLDPRALPSVLLDKPAPSITLATLQDPEKLLTNQDFKGKVSLLNVWATWCVSCRQEHAVLMDIAKQNVLPIYGLDYKDKREDALRWIRLLGNPYIKSGFDADGREAIDWGVYGTPESFIIDKKGLIRYKYLGPITREAWQQQLLPLITKLQLDPAV